MAEAAENQVHWIRRLYKITVVEIFALIATVIAALAAVIYSARASKAAQQSVAVARETAERQLRAYMSLVPAGATYNPITGAFTVYVAQKNNGATPAKDVTLSARLRFLTFPLQNNPLPPPEFGTSKNVVFPGQNFVTDHLAALRVDRRELGNMLNRCKRLYFTGQIKYTDIYGIIRKTIVCWSYSIEGMDEHIDKFTAWRAVEDDRANKPAPLDWDYAPRHNRAT